MSHHPIKFECHKSCGIGDKMVLVCHAILQEHVIKGSCDVMSRSPSW